MDRIYARGTFPDKEEAGRSSRPRPTHETGGSDLLPSAPCVTDASEPPASARHRLPADLHERPEGAAHSHSARTNVADPYPNLTAIADRGELVYRPGFGWVTRPVAS